MSAPDSRKPGEDWCLACYMPNGEHAKDCKAEAVAEPSREQESLDRATLIGGGVSMPPCDQRVCYEPAWRQLVKEATARHQGAMAQWEAAEQKVMALEKALPNVTEALGKAEQEATELRAALGLARRLIRETLNRRANCRDLKILMPTDCGTWDRMEALLANPPSEPASTEKEEK